MRIFCFSGYGYSAQIANYFSARLGIPVEDIMENSQTDTAIVIFPVYCQNVPVPVIGFLRSLRAESIVLIASYGGIHHGNAIWEAAGLNSAQVMGAAYVPTGHSFLNEEKRFDMSALEPIFERIASPRSAVIKKEKKQLFADLFPAWRSRTGIKIIRNTACTDCGLCTSRCPMNAIKNGLPQGNCIRCLRCVANCPNHALSTKLTKVMKHYFAAYAVREDKTELYL